MKLTKRELEQVKEYLEFLCSGISTELRIAKGLDTKIERNAVLSNGIKIRISLYPETLETE